MIEVPPGGLPQQPHFSLRGFWVLRRCGQDSARALGLSSALGGARRARSSCPWPSPFSPQAALPEEQGPVKSSRTLSGSS